MEKELFRTNFIFEMEDWMNFQLHFLYQNKTFKRTKFFSLIMIPFFFTIVLIVDILNGKFNIIGLAIYIIFSIIWLVFYKIRFEKAYKKRIQKMLNAGDNSSLLGKHTLIFEEEYLLLIQPKTENKIKYDGIVKAEETENYYFLYDTGVSAIIVPKQKIDKADLIKLKNIIEKKIAKPFV